MAPRPGERGFTLVEMLVATGIWIVLGGTLLYVTQGLLSDAKVVTAQQSAYTELTHLLEVWESEATSSLAIFVPSTDVLGFDNSDGHELDFYSRDAARQGHFWAYRWDADALTLQRYAYSVPGRPATPSDPPVTGITAFSAVRLAASTIARPFLAGYVPRDVVVNFGYPEVNGGNAIASVTVANARNRFEIELLPGTMVSGFGVIVGTFQPAATPAPSSVPSTTPAPTSTPGQFCRITATRPVLTEVCYSWLGFVTTSCDATGTCIQPATTLCLDTYGGEYVTLYSSQTGSSGDISNTYNCWGNAVTYGG
jgi:hypothetical protein